MFSGQNTIVDYADFTRFISHTDLRAYLEVELPLDRTSKSEVNAFLATQEIFHCNDEEDTIRIQELRPEIEALNLVEKRCTVLAPQPDDPSKDWFTKFAESISTVYKYRIAFVLSSDVLIKIYVDRIQTSL